jgi:hypothetical protein
MQYTTAFIAAIPLLISSTQAAAVPAVSLTSRAGACSSYTIIDTRGTGEMQGPSVGFRSMNQKIQAQAQGGKVHDTVYPADFSQNSAQGTKDIVNTITQTLQKNKNECFILQGYSQGAAATVNAMPQISGASFDAVKAVVLIGDPMHKPNLACNVDNMGGSSTKGASGISAALGKGIPQEWVGKTLDICISVSGLLFGLGVLMS